MTRETDYLIQSLFERESLEEMTLDELRGLSEQYPFSSIIQFLYSCKLKSLYHLDFPEVLSKTALFFDNPFWLDHQLSDEQDLGKFRLGQYSGILEQNEENQELEVQEVQDKTEEQEIVVPVSPDTASDSSSIIPIEPYHTVDYFASQGIKLSNDDPKDDLGKKVKSFTAWLKTMKRLQPEIEKNPSKNTNFSSEETNQEAELPEPVLTEAMAAVYLKQGMTDKAIEIYQKLSLQNPANSHIFASQIASIKENNI